MFKYKTTRLLAAAVSIWLSAIFPAQAGAGQLMFFILGSANNLTSAVVGTDGAARLQLPLERECMAFALYHEARGEPEAGQKTVAATILNRVLSSAYPDTICGVVYQNAAKKFRCQFSFACDDLTDVPRNAKSFHKMKQIGDKLIGTYLTEANPTVNGPHVSNREYTHYHRYDVSPSWSKSLQPLGRIGAHVFFRSERVTRRYRENIAG